MRVAVVIVSYNTCALLRNCLRSVFAATACGFAPDNVPTLDVIVVDNASADHSAHMVSTEFPQVHLIALQENIGFTAANNHALRHLGFIPTRRHSDTPTDLRPNYVFLLNPDAELVDDTLAQLVQFMEETPCTGVCGAHLGYGDGTFQHGAFQFPSLVQVALDFWPLRGVPGAHRLHNSRLNGRYPQRLWQGGAPFPVDFVLGAAMFVRGAAIEQVGGLDEGFFMYCEEMDWCLRMWEAGWPVYAVPTARVLHHEAQSSRQVRWSAFVELWRSRFRFYHKHRRHFPPGHRVAVCWIIRAGLAWRRRQAWRRFGRGEIDGVSLAKELGAYASVIADNGF